MKMINQSLKGGEYWIEHGKIHHLEYVHGTQVGELDTVTAVAFQKKRLCTHFDRNSGKEECKRKVEQG